MSQINSKFKDLKVVFDIWDFMHGKENVKMRLYVWRAFHLSSIDEDIRYWDNFDFSNNWNVYEFSKFWRYKKGRPYFEISRPPAFLVLDVYTGILQSLCSWKMPHGSKTI